MAAISDSALSDGAIDQNETRLGDAHERVDGLPAPVTAARRGGGGGVCSAACVQRRVCLIGG